MTPRGADVSERSASATTPTPDGDYRAQLLNAGITEDELDSAVQKLAYLAIDDPVGFQDRVVGIIRDPSLLEQAAINDPRLLVEAIGALRGVVDTVNDQLTHWRSTTWSQECQQAWPAYQEHRRAWEETHGDSGVYAVRNIPPSLRAELEKRWDVEYRIRAAAAFRRHIGAEKSLLESRAKYLYPHATATQTARARARNDTIGRYRRFYLDRVRHHQDSMARRS